MIDTMLSTVFRLSTRTRVSAAVRAVNRTTTALSTRSTGTASAQVRKSLTLPMLSAVGLAAACTLMVTPAYADDAITAATPATAPVPSAIDSSSRRVIRLATPSDKATPAGLSEAQSIMESAGTTPSDSVQFNNNASANNPPIPTAPVSRPQAQSLPVKQTPAKRAASGRLSARTHTPRSQGIDVNRAGRSNILIPQIHISDISFINTILIPQTTGGNDKLDVSLIDDFIADVSPNVRHYPPNFPNRSQRHYTREKIKAFVEWIQPYASAPNASYEVLIRAAKLNAMGRNLDLGSDYAVRGGQFVDRAIKLDPNSAEANFLYGMMLSEGGGFKEGQKYLNRAVALGYTEAEQSLAQSDLLSDRRSQALDRLRKLQQRLPNDPIIAQQIKLVEDGKFYIWDIPAPNINVKPIK